VNCIAINGISSRIPAEIRMMVSLLFFMPVDFNIGKIQPYSSIYERISWFAKEVVCFRSISIYF
jgi:hypothetical protein